MGAHRAELRSDLTHSVEKDFGLVEYELLSRRRKHAGKILGTHGRYDCFLGDGVNYKVRLEEYRVALGKDE